MGERSKIEWTDATFNPWVGCSKVSQACTHCYAESWARRTGKPDLWRGERRRTTPSNWRQPLKWDAQARADGVPRRVFCASLADVFEDHPSLPPWRADLWDLISETPSLRWLLLTKRPENILRMIPDHWRSGLPSSVWVGTTVEDQARANERIPELIRVPAEVRFLSCEPLLGSLDLTRWAPGGIARWVCSECGSFFANPGRTICPVVGCSGVGTWEPNPEWRRPGGQPISWVISGGESGGGARPTKIAWFRGLRDQCAAAGIPYLHKQNGEHLSEGLDSGGFEVHTRVGKARAGRLLDGRTHDGLPPLGRAFAAAEG